MLIFSLFERAAQATIVASDIYTIRPGDTLKKIVDQYYERYPAYDKDNLQYRVIRFNPHVTNWNHLIPGLKIFLASPLNGYMSAYNSFFLTKGCMLNRQLFKRYGVINSCKELYAHYPGYNLSFKFVPPKKRLSMFTFYAVSTGEQVETENGVESSILQNSPITLGLGGIYSLSSGNALVSSAYVSQYSVIDSEYEGDDLPYEFGMNLYYQWNRPLVSPYLGMDFESLGSIDYNNLLEAGRTRTLSRKLIYLTAGVSKMFTVKQMPLLLKASLSYSAIASSRDPADLTGFKYILFASLKVWKDISISTFLKQHHLQTNHDIDITRYGFGVSYSFL